MLGTREINTTVIVIIMIGGVGHSFCKHDILKINIVREIFPRQSFCILDLRDNYQARSTNYQKMFGTSADKSCCG